MSDRAMIFMREAISLSLKGMQQNEGGPFGCVIVKNNEIIGRGNNKVLVLNDPTAHAEITAIRDACRSLNIFQLDDCEIYSSCEPCPMCLGAIYWARIGKIYYACTRTDAAQIGFSDEIIYNEFPKEKNERIIPMVQLLHNEAYEIFKDWMAKPDKIVY